MDKVLVILFLATLMYFVWIIRMYIYEQLAYKRIRAKEIQRRLDSEVRSEKVAVVAINNEPDDLKKIVLELELARQRHVRHINYVIADVYEKWR